MNNRKILIIGLGIIAACLLTCAVYMFANRSTKREPTQQEIEACAPYAVDWQSALGAEGSDKEIILGMCTFAGEETIGENVYKTYTSDTLGGYLYAFGEMIQIALLNDTTLYVQYTADDGDMVILAYSDDGLCEKGVYDVETDTFFYEWNGMMEVWKNFRNGNRWGA